MRNIRFSDSRLRDSVAMEIARTFRSQSRVFGKAIKEHGVSQVQATVLLTLWLEGAKTMGELQAMLQIGSSTLTGVIDRMEKGEMVSRVAVPGDRRAYRLQPAQWSKRRRDALIDTLLATEEEIFEGLTRTEYRQLLSLLRKVAAPATPR